MTTSASPRPEDPAGDGAVTVVRRGPAGAGTPAGTIVRPPQE
ncbi:MULTISPECIES: hypothetical protein [unclassified Pseudonocardia]|nr:MULTISPECIES: hypothetical protein [unclassified Pseudonocardia]